MNAYLQEVLTACKQFRVPKERQKFLQENIYRSQLEVIGLSVVQLRALLKNGFSFSDKPFDQQKQIWDFIFRNASIFEVMSMALIWYQSYTKQLEVSDWKILKSWAMLVENWEHSDRLCSMYAVLLEKYPKQVLPQLEKWNRSKHPWLRRISLVSLFYYAKLDKTYVSFSKAKSLIHSLINDEHFYVQKAVGWTLREMYRVYPEKTYTYLQTIAIDLPAAAWQAATERLPKADKQFIKKIRNN